MTHYEKIYPIASRCGVFAKTRHPAASQPGRPERGRGGVSISGSGRPDHCRSGAGAADSRARSPFWADRCTSCKGLRDRFQRDAGHWTMPMRCSRRTATALPPWARRSVPLAMKKNSTMALYDRLEHSVTSRGQADSLPPLFANQAEYDAFLARHNANAPPVRPLESYTGEAYLGIDAGSTTTKLVLIDPDGGLLYTYYASNRGDPVRVRAGAAAATSMQRDGRAGHYPRQRRDRLRRGSHPRRVPGGRRTGGDHGALSRQRPTSSRMWTSSSTSADRTSSASKSATAPWTPSCSTRHVPPAAARFIETFAKALGYDDGRFCPAGPLCAAPGEPRLPLHRLYEQLRQAGAEGRRDGGGYLRRSVHQRREKRGL